MSDFCGFQIYLAKTFALFGEGSKQAETLVLYLQSVKAET